VATAGAVVVITGSAVGSFLLVMLGSTLFGSGTATNLQARYAATDLATASTRARALATAVWATTVGVVLGPNLTGPGGDLARTVGPGRPKRSIRTTAPSWAFACRSRRN
jgi:hypothetical protein